MSISGDDVSRRAFVATAARVGSLGTAAVWVAPKLTSTAYAAGGSPPPGAPKVVEQGKPTAPGIPGPNATPAAPSGGGVLPFTGANPVPLTVTGLTAIAAGAGMLAWQRRMPDLQPPR